MKKLIAEFVSTFILVFIGCGATVTLNALVAASGFQLPLAFTALTVALAFGAAYVLAYNSFGKLSGGHMNPAVTTAMLIVGKMEDVKEWALYVVGQFAGGILAAATLLMVTGQNASLGQNGYGYSSALQISVASGLLIEAILTFIFVSLFLFMAPTKNHAGSDHGRGVRGIILGLGITACYLVALPFTGASLNPARSLGPAIFVGDQALRQLWLFIVAPLIGGAIAAFVYKALNKPEKVKEDKEENPSDDKKEESEEEKEYVAEAKTEAEAESKDEAKTEPKESAETNSKEETEAKTETESQYNSSTGEIKRPEIACQLDYLNDELIKYIEEARAEERRQEELENQ